MSRRRAPIAFVVAAFSALSLGCEIEAPAELDEVEVDRAAIQLPDNDDDNTEEEYPPIVLQSRWLKAPDKYYLYADLARIHNGDRNFLQIVSADVAANDEKQGNEDQVQLRNGVLGMWQKPPLVAQMFSWRPATTLNLRPAALKNYWLELTFDNPSGPPHRVQRDYKIVDAKRLSEFGAERGVPWHADTEVPKTYLYKLQSAGGQPLCTPPPNADPGHAIWNYALALPLTWTGRGDVDRFGHVAAGGTLFTFACLNSAAAKCRAWGYNYDAIGSRHAVNACTRMVMADYCEAGQSYTIDGVSIDFADSEFVNDVEHWNTAGQVHEALWSRRGVLCLSNYRIKESMRVTDFEDGQPTDRAPDPDDPDGSEGLCFGTNAFDEPLVACDEEDFRNPHLSRWARAGEVVIANSSELGFWIVSHEIPEDAVWDGVTGKYEPPVYQPIPTPPAKEQPPASPPPSTSPPPSPPPPPVFIPPKPNPKLPRTPGRFPGGGTRLPF